MQRRIQTALRFLTVALVVGASASWAETETPSFRTAEEPDLTIEFRAEAGSLAARDLRVSSECDRDRQRAAQVNLAWAANRAAALDAQRIDITKFREGFTSGSFETTGAMDAAAQEVMVQSPEPGINYYWRVLSRTEDGWVSSPVGRFEVPICPLDPIEEGQAPGILLNEGSR